MDGHDGRLPVVGVEEDPIGKLLDSLGQPIEPTIELDRLARGKAELENLAADVALDELAGRALGDDPRLVHDNEPIAELLGFVHVVGRQDEGHPLLLEPIELVPEEVAGLRVEAGRRLVEEEEIGLVHEGSGDRQASLHPARERLHLGVGPIEELDEVEEGVGATPGLGPGKVEVAAVDDEVLPDGQLHVEGVLLWHDPEAGPDPRAVDGRIEAEDTKGAGGDRGDAADHPHRRGLPGPVRAEEAEGLPAADVEVDRVDSGESTEALRQPPGVDERKWLPSRHSAPQDSAEPVLPPNRGSSAPFSGSTTTGHPTSLARPPSVDIEAGDLPLPASESRVGGPEANLISTLEPSGLTSVAIPARRMVSGAGGGMAASHAASTRVRQKARRQALRHRRQSPMDFSRDKPLHALHSLDGQMTMRSSPDAPGRVISRSSLAIKTTATPPAVAVGSTGRTSRSPWPQTRYDEAPMDPYGIVDGVGDGKAPGRPGIPPTWTSSRKDAIGTAIGPSRVWFTVGNGIVNEVYWPHVDRPQVRDLGFLVADDAGFWAEVKRLPDRRVEWLAPGVPAVRTEFRHERFRLRLRICTDRDRDVLLVEAGLDAGAGDLRVYPLLAPHLGRSGADNTAWLVATTVGPAVVAERRPYAVALVAEPAPERGSVGFVGVSDGWQDFARNGRMTWAYGSAEAGNVAGMLEIRPNGRPIRLALGFGERPAQALVTAVASLQEPFEAHWARYEASWRSRAVPSSGDRTAAARLAGVPRHVVDCYERSIAVIRAHEDRVTRGAIAASLSIPWGEVGDDPGGYHLIWSRDLVEAAGALLAAGDLEAAARTFAYLAASQRPDGSWPQNQWIDGTAYWRGAQLDEIAFPILLARQLRDAGAFEGTSRRPPLVDPELATRTVRRAMTAIARNGPATGQDRWEEDAGLAPATLGPVIAALVAGSAFLEARASRAALELADDWNASLERWVYAPGSPLARRLGLSGTYVRIAPTDVLVGGPLDAPVAVRNRLAPGDRVSAVEMVSPDVLALVRFGLRDPHDPRIVETLTAVDATLRIDTPAGPVWRRYTGDGYGETEDGGPFRGVGVGRGWPLLTGERGHYVLAAGGDARPFLVAMAAMGGEAGLIPEQVWDGPPRAELGLVPGQPTGSARPLVWAHAEFVKLYRSILLGAPVDRPAGVLERWGGRTPTTNRQAWRLAHPIESIDRGETLRIELLEPALVHLSTDGWATVRDLAARDTGLGLWVVDLEPGVVGDAEAIVFTLYWTGSGRWEGRDFSVRVQSAPARAADHATA